MLILKKKDLIKTGCQLVKQLSSVNEKIIDIVEEFMDNFYENLAITFKRFLNGTCNNLNVKPKMNDALKILINLQTPNA